MEATEQNKVQTERKSIYSKIGRKGLWYVTLRGYLSLEDGSIFRLPHFFYGKARLEEMFRNTYTLEEFKEKHLSKRDNDREYRDKRSLGIIVLRLLEIEYGIPGGFKQIKHPTQPEQPKFQMFV